MTLLFTSPFCLPLVFHLRCGPISDIGSKFKIRWCTTEIHNNNILFLANFHSTRLRSQAQLLELLHLPVQVLSGGSAPWGCPHLMDPFLRHCPGRWRNCPCCSGTPSGAWPLKHAVCRDPFLGIHSDFTCHCVSQSSFFTVGWTRSIFEPKPAVVPNCVPPGKLSVLSVHQAFDIKSKVFGIQNPPFPPLRAWFWTESYTALVCNIEIFFFQQVVIKGLLYCIHRIRHAGMN